MNIKNYIKRSFNYLLHGIPTTVVNTEISLKQPSDLLKGRTALITGGTSGIGLCIAKAFVDAGANVIITSRSQKRIDSVVSGFSNTSGQLFGIVLDNKDVDSYKTAIQDVFTMLEEKGLPQVDILVNNAGVNSSVMPNATADEFDNVMNTNLRSSFFLSQFIGKYMVDNRIKGNILNIASASSLRPANSAYTISKWGIRGLTLGLAKSLAPYGITVNGLAPGPTATPMLGKSEKSNMKLDRLPLGRYITPEEIAGMAVVLVSDMGRSIMGDIVYMTGGAGILTYDDVPYSF